MVTINQLAKKKKRIIPKLKWKKLALANCPQKKGTCVKIYILTPKKPCSARRAVTRVRLSNRKIVTCHIPGVGHNLKKFSTVLVRGGRPNDLPAVKYRVIHGAKRTDLNPLFTRRKARSKYGVKDLSRLHQTRLRLRTKSKKILIDALPVRQ
jgi:small subunit ribosomal protein S12